MLFGACLAAHVHVIDTCRGGWQVLQQLDGEGCARVCSVLKSMPQASVLVVAQANSYVMQVCMRLQPCPSVIFMQRKNKYQAS